MLQNKLLRIPSLGIVFVSFFLSNVSAFFAFNFWLTPALVLGEAIIWVVFAAFAAWILFIERQTGDFLGIIKRNWIILPFLIFSGASIFWSDFWQISLTRWVILICTIITGGTIGLRYDIKQIIKLLSYFGIFILLLSSIFIFLFPSIGVMNYHSIQSAWKGIYWHKNHMGLIATFINILFFINIIDCVKSNKKQIIIWGLLYVYSLLFVYQTDSVTAYFTTIILHGLILLGLLWIKFRDKVRRYHYFIAGGVIIVAALLILVNIHQIFAIFNRDTTLTGRIPMWTHLFSTYLSQRPILGYGFNAFWYLGSHRVAMQQMAGYLDQIVISDNGFIDILINTGFSGLILILIILFWGVVAVHQICDQG